ncbi:ATP-binding domain-containing protein [Acinetobacter pittii]|uniref:DEAD/DEAH box helicase n=1 Tax=Acinetobacter pittii TaxID=48296 RepID=UPI0021CD8ADA|nr:ATP-binding domain-containing protein [Acinetobacter pittii]MCU4549723.1 ATP-binding domain-containing protein [Acinetobacter pittii]MDO7383961.1 ATP-binding domain-containing protein [Acinetobacter baumannii]
MSNFDFIAGSIAITANSSPFTVEISKKIQALLNSCNGYFAYKFASISQNKQQDIPSFLIVTQEYGILIVDIVEKKIDTVIQLDDNEFWQSGDDYLISREIITLDYEDAVKARLKSKATLYNRKNKKFNVEIQSIIIFCENTDFEDFLDKELNINGLNFSDFDEYLNKYYKNPQKEKLSEEIFDQICSQIDGTFIFEKKIDLKSLIENPPLKTMNDFIQQSLNVTFSQDRIQRQASMQLPDGVQRIRGLAGTGKTIVLCLKAALTHALPDNFKILYLFNTQSLYTTIQNTITTYYGHETGKVPDFYEKLRIFHAWGGANKAGLYSELCKELGIKPLSYTQLRGSIDPLKSLYADLLKKAGDRIEPIYDLVLIDEAQDFAPEIFEVIYKLTKGEKEKKRIIWAYDEFQSLSDTVMREPEELFGRDHNNQPNIANSSLQGTYEGGIKKDFILPNCYRTPRPVLMTAHGIAMGLYAARKTHMFYERTPWEAIGYTVLEPITETIEENSKVVLQRPDSNSLNRLEKLLIENKRAITELIHVEECSSYIYQIEYIAKECSRLIYEEEVSPEQIIIINLSKGNNKDEMLLIANYLNNKGLSSVIPGYIESADIFQPKGQITITTPFRAKGNESNVVFLLNAHLVANDHTPKTRNSFFVSLTRSRGWCYVVGMGEGIKKLNEEIKQVLTYFPKFEFIAPKKSEVTGKLNYLTTSDKEIKNINDALNLIKSNPELLKLLDPEFLASAITDQKEDN